LSWNVSPARIRTRSERLFAFIRARSASWTWAIVVHWVASEGAPVKSPACDQTIVFAPAK
jgi:hypothetical protein